MNSLITIIIFFVIASFIQSALGGNKNKKGVPNRRPVAGGRNTTPVSGAELLRQILEQQTMNMSAQKQKSNNEADWTDAFENEGAAPVEGVVGTSDGAVLTDEGKYLTTADIGFGVLSYNSDEGKELEANVTQQPAQAWSDQNRTEKEEPYLDIDRTDFQKAFVLSEILGQPRALKPNIK